MQYPNRIIQKGETVAQIVRAIQSRLKALGYTPIDVDGDFGKQTEATVKLFQAKNTDANGRPLTIDGKVGPSTWRALFGAETLVTPGPAAPTAFISKVLEIAAKELGTKEIPDGSNAGPRVEEYLRSVGLGKGNPWCMAFVYWCFGEASKALGIPNPLVKTGLVLGQWSASKQKRIKQADVLANFGLVKPGQIFIMNFGDGKGHTGIVESVQGNILTTIEGNTNSEGSREGNGVFRRTSRTLRAVNKGFIEVV